MRTSFKALGAAVCNEETGCKPDSGNGGSGGGSAASGGSNGGCGCRVAGERDVGEAALGAGALLAIWFLRRKRRA